MRRSPLTVILILCALTAVSPARGGVPFLRGDVNDDGVIDLSDPIAGLLHLFAGRPRSVPLDALDANDDGRADLADALHLLGFLFQEGPPPPAPFPGVGFDATPTDPLTDGDPPLPDLFADVSVGENGHLLITIENQGMAPVPAGAGALELWVDGYFVREYALAELPDPSFLQPNHSVDFDTGIRLAGMQRRVAVLVDPGREIAEENELQNSATRTLNLNQFMAHADLDILELGVDPVSEELRVTVVNRGRFAFAEGATLPLRVEVGGKVLERTVDVPPLGSVVNFQLVIDPPIHLAASQRVTVRLDTSAVEGEDFTNGIRGAYLPHGLPLYEKFLVQRDWLRGRIRWTDANGTRVYDSWTPAMQQDLWNAILDLELGRPYSPSPPTATQDGGYWYHPSSSSRIFVHHVAQALFVQVRKLVPWKVFPDDPHEGIEFLPHFLDSKNLFVYDAVNDRCRFATETLGATTAWNPRVGYEFLRTLGLLRGTQEETIQAFSEWGRAYLRHITNLDDNVYGYTGFAPTDRCLYALEGKDHVAAGCGGMTGIYATVLKSVNIPVVRAGTQFGSATHHRPDFPSVGLSMPHGDDVYTAYLTPTGDRPVPIHELFYTDAEMEALFLNPTVDCAGGSCNSPGEQASYNSTKDHLQRTFDHGSDWPLYTYALFGAARLDEHLTYIPNGTTPIVFVKPLFSPAERAAMIAQVEARLLEIGGGDMLAGQQTVIRRSYNYIGNKFSP